MKHFISYIVFICICLSIALLLKNQKVPQEDNRPIVRVFGNTSFVSKWGPGPILKESFEKECNCKVEFFDSSDSNVLLQKLQNDVANSSADVVVGFDQFDLEKAQQVLSWKKINLPVVEWEDSIMGWSKSNYFIPYDYGILAFNFRKSDNINLPKHLEDLLEPIYKKKISLEDPRTSSPGMQFLFWLVKLKGEEEAFKYLAKLSENIMSISPSWSSAYGLFQKGQAKTVFSYVTSPIYHLVEEKSQDYQVAEFSEGHPMQVEYVGIPAVCKSCELAEKFVTFMLSPQGQSILMNKNYMLPVLRGVRKDTPFDAVANIKIFENSEIPSMVEREKILQHWAEFRRSNGF